MFEFQKKCPLCGTQGKSWKNDPQTFVCPSCSTVYSMFGLVLESEKEFSEN